jgi:hypothetical protein
VHIGAHQTRAREKNRSLKKETTMSAKSEDVKLETISAVAKSAMNEKTVTIEEVTRFSKVQREVLSGLSTFQTITGNLREFLGKTSDGKKWRVLLKLA